MNFLKLVLRHLRFGYTSVQVPEAVVKHFYEIFGDKLSVKDGVHKFKVHKVVFLYGGGIGYIIYPRFVKVKYGQKTFFRILNFHIKEFGGEEMELYYP